MFLNMSKKKCEWFLISDHFVFYVVALIEIQNRLIILLTYYCLSKMTTRPAAVASPLDFNERRTKKVSF